MDEIEFYDKVKDFASLKDREEARKITAAVLKTLAMRLPEAEIEDLKAQLPLELKDMLKAEKLEKLHYREFIEKIKNEAKLESFEKAEQCTLAVFRALKQVVSWGEIEDIIAVLPEDLKELWKNV